MDEIENILGTRIAHIKMAVHNKIGDRAAVAVTLNEANDVHIFEGKDVPSAMQNFIRNFDKLIMLS